VETILAKIKNRAGKKDKNRRFIGILLIMLLEYLAAFLICPEYKARDFKDQIPIFDGKP
jgi:hypothetical protein